jgi:hypothetical protein
MCLQDKDTAQHILAYCVYAREVWFCCLRDVGLLIEEPQIQVKFEDWWISAREQVRQGDRRKFDSLVILVSWMLWKQQNARVFCNTGDFCNATQLVA